jgi:hypothetical protein
VLPADYVAAHVELAYASTAHGVQGDTVPTAHLVVGESTGAASAYVGMTRGREANTAHLVAADLAEARQQWIAVFARDRADLGPAHAAELAAREAARYAEPRPLERVLADLHAAWTTEEDCRARLSLEEPSRDKLRQIVALGFDPYERMQAAKDLHHQTWRDADHAEQQLRAADVVVGGDTHRIRKQLLDAWDADRVAASQAARVVVAGPGRFGARRAAVTRAGQQLTAWGDAWRPYLPFLSKDLRGLAADATWFDNYQARWSALTTVAREAAEQAHPEYAAAQAAAAAARTVYEQAAQALEEAKGEERKLIGRFGGIALTPDPAGQLADLDREAAEDRAGLAAAQARIAQLTREPALGGQAADRLARERDTWQARREAELNRRYRDRTAPAEESVYRRHRHEEHHARSTGRPGHGIGR